MKLSNKFFISLILAGLLSCIFGITRVFWVTKTDVIFTMSNIWIYMSLIFESLVLSFMPSLIWFIQRHKYEHKQKSQVASISIVVVLSCIALLLALSMTYTIGQSFIELNPQYSPLDTYIFLIISAFALLFSSISKGYYNIATTEKDFYAPLIIVFVQIAFQISYDLIFLSTISIIEPSIIALSISNFMGSFTLFMVLFFWYLIRKNINIKLFITSLKNIKKDIYFDKLVKLMIISMITSLIVNFTYATLTLGILNNNLTSNEFNAWNVTMYYYYSIVLISSNAIIVYMAAIYQDSNYKIINIYKYMAINWIAWSLLTIPLNQYFIPWNINYADYVNLSQKTIFVMLPTMILLTFNQIKSQDLILKGENIKILTITGLYSIISSLIILYVMSFTQMWYLIAILNFSIGIYIMSICYLVLSRKEKYAQKTKI